MGLTSRASPPPLGLCQSLLPRRSRLSFLPPMRKNWGKWGGNANLEYSVESEKNIQISDTKGHLTHQQQGPEMNQTINSVYNMKL